MNQKEHDQEWLMDKYYNELTGKAATGGDENADGNEELQHFQLKMEACLEKMNVLGDRDVELKFDMLELIQQGEIIRAAKERREEGKAFIIAAGITVCSILFWGYLLGPKIIIYGQMILLGIAMLTGMPLVKYLDNREGSI
ncbi:MAG: hypothetical protein ACYC0N_03580 [Carboxydocellales bacterium]